MAASIDHETEVGISVPETKKPADQVTELKDLVVGYAEQEAVDPIRKLGRYFQYGASGAFLISIGVLFLLYALLRGLQTVDAFTPDNPFNPGALTLVPYAITVVVGIAIMAYAGWRIQNGERNQRGEKR